MIYVLNSDCVFFANALDFSTPFLDSSTPKRNEALTMLKLKKAFDEEISKRRIVDKQLQHIQKKLANANASTEDSIR